MPMPAHSLDTNASQATSAPAASPQAEDLAELIRTLRLASVAWSERPWQARLRLLGRVAGELALRASELTDSVYRPAATAGEIMASEVVPLAEACRYLARYGGRELKPRRLSGAGRAWWMGRIGIVQARQPLGVVLIIGPANYPLFLNAVPLLQALAAGNAVLVKPAPHCQAAMHTLRSIVMAAGVPAELVHVLDTSPAAAAQAIELGVDKVVFTGSLANGKQVARLLAQSMTPGTFELSGNDAVLVMESADLERVAAGLAYALSLNGGQTCIAPRRLLATRATLEKLLPLLRLRLDAAPARSITGHGCQAALRALDQSLAAGARLDYGARGDLAQATAVRPMVLTGVEPSMAVVREDLFAPLLSVMEVGDMRQAVLLANDCPYALGASIFGEIQAASQLAQQLRAPCVTVNDVIVPTADPRVSFGGRGGSGYGVTRGLEGLRELTQLKVICQRQGRWMPHLTTPGEQLATLMRAILLIRHGRRLSDKWSGFKAMISAGKPPRARGRTGREAR